MFKRDEFLQKEKILRFVSVDEYGFPHVVPVWYMYNTKKFYIGTNMRTKKARNLNKNQKVSFCVDSGIKSPNIFGVSGSGIANLILDTQQVSKIAKKILLRYFTSLNNKSAKELLAETDCIIEIIPKKIIQWNY